MTNNLDIPSQDPSRQPRGGPAEHSGGYAYRFLDGREREKSYSSSRERNGRDVSSTRTYGSGRGSRQIEDVLDHISSEWDVVTQDECVPVYLGLQLMDHSSLGRGGDYQDFQRTNRQLQKALKAIVNEHHQGFNSSIGTFHQIQASIQASQNRVRELKEAVQSAQSHLMVTSPELVELGFASRSYDDMLQYLTLIEKLQAVPEQLDARISDKRFLSAVDILQDALRMVRKSDMEHISALSDLQTYFGNQETSLTDIFIEELHDHVYLKSAYCQDRWKPYKADDAGSQANDGGSASLPNSWGRSLYRFLESLNTNEALDDNASKNPEANSFEFMHTLLESLSRLGRLDFAVECLNQRLPVELFAVVDKTNREVEIRHPLALGGLYESRKHGTLEDSEGDAPFKAVLNDFLWTLFSKFEAIAEGHRAVHDVINGIAEREGLRNRKALGTSFQEMWKLFQSEMRSLLHDYLATDGSSGDHTGRGPTNGSNIFHKGPRDRSKRVFKLIDIDKKSSDLISEQEELDSIMKASVPGLVSKNQRRSLLNAPEESSRGPTATHKLLVQPNVFNISLLLPPSLVFLQRLRDIVPPESNIASSTLTSFLDDFLVNVFYPQLEETVSEHCTRAFLEPDAFLQDPEWQKHGDRPVFKGVSAFFLKIQAFCRLLDSVPADQIFTQLILSQIVTYYDKCCEWYQTIVGRPQIQNHGQKSAKPAAAMAQSGEIHDVVESLWNRPSADDISSDLLHQETDLLLSVISSSLQPMDIISDRRTVSALCLLHNSLSWLSTKLATLRPSSSPSKLQPAPHTRRWTQLSLHTTTTSHPTLFLTPETLAPFTNLLSSLQNLSDLALRTLHLDIRLGVLHILSSRLIPGPYLLSAPTDPDPAVLSLNNDLLSFDDTLISTLTPRDRDFVTAGLTLLIDTSLIKLTPGIKAMNTLGCARMQLSILILQQNLKAIEPDANLSRSAQYFGIFEHGAEEIVKEARESGYTLEELKEMLRLVFSEGVGSTQREVSQKARKEFGERELGLSEVMWDA